jgi:hypothetical protein
VKGAAPAGGRLNMAAITHVVTSRRAARTCAASIRIFA